MSQAPLLFIHYAPASYLTWTLRAARRTNPEKRIILLGDESNRAATRGIAEFFPFEEYAVGKKLAEFDRSFQIIQGKRHQFHKQRGIEFWLKFVFRRWFLIHEFLKIERIDSFWIFDSDTLLLSSLKLREQFFSEVEATTQCQGKCLNGWVASQHLVERYITCINQLFNDSSYLQAQQERLKKHAGLAFNEMDAFTEFCHRTSLKTCRASEVIEGASFDDALAITDGYESASQKILNKTAIKRLWISKDGALFAKRSADQQFVRLLSCNMSWMPDFFWKRLFKLTASSKNSCFSPEKNILEADLQEVNLDLPIFLKLKNYIFKKK